MKLLGVLMAAASLLILLMFALGSTGATPVDCPTKALTSDDRAEFYAARLTREFRAKHGSNFQAMADELNSAWYHFSEAHKRRLKICKSIPTTPRPKTLWDIWMDALSPPKAKPGDVVGTHPRIGK